MSMETIQIEVRSDPGNGKDQHRQNRAVRALSIREIPDASGMDEYTVPALASSFSEDILRSRLNRKNTAILSYRKDDKAQERVHAAIQVCRRGNFHFLLVDQVCLDRHSTQQEVEEYIDMYRRLSVIVHLDKPDDAFRPWIYKELSIAKHVVDTNVILPTHLFSKKPKVRPAATTIVQSACINWQYNRIPIVVFWTLGAGATASVYYLLNLSLLISAIVSFLAVMLLIPLVVQPIGQKLSAEIERRRGFRLTYRESEERAITKLLDEGVLNDPWDLLLNLSELVEHEPVLSSTYPPREFRARWNGSPTFRRLILAQKELKTIRVSENGWSYANYKNVKNALELCSNFHDRTGIPVHCFIDHPHRTITFLTSGAKTGITFISQAKRRSFNNLHQETLAKYIRDIDLSGGKF